MISKALITLTFLAAVVVSLPSAPSYYEDEWLKVSEAPDTLVGAGGTVALSYSDCSGSKMHVKGVKVAFSPKQPSLGDTLTVTASGKLDEAITGGTYTFKAKKLGITLASHTDTVCGKTSFKVAGLPVSVKGVDCSNTKPGSIGISLGIGLPRVAPHVGLVVQVTGKDSNNGGLFCVNVNVKVEAAAAVERSATAIGFPASANHTELEGEIVDEQIQSSSTDLQPRSRFLGTYDRIQSPHSVVSPSDTVGTNFDVAWRDLQPSADTIDFSKFDKLAKSILSRGKAFTYRVRTGSGFAPEWIYDKGVPQVKVPGSEHIPHSNGIWPYYLSPAYTKLFHSMHVALKEHVEKSYTPEELQACTGVEGLFGSTGDVTPWHGNPSDSKYRISQDQWYVYWANETIVMAKLYADWLSDTKRDFYLITRGLERFTSDSLRTSVVKAIPRGRYAISDHLVCKEYMQNGERTTFTTKDLTNRLTHTQKDGNYVLSNCRQDVGLPEGKTDIVVTNWQTILSMLTWGQDRLTTQYVTSARQRSVLGFFNRYAGGRPTNGKSIAGAWASLRDGLDAADKERFPDHEFGGGGGGCTGIIAKYKSMGARQDDTSIGPDSRMNGRGRHSMNDCGWDISPDNYNMFLKQIDPANTSVGMWRVGDFNSGKPGQFFGRFARSFQHATGKNDMSFAVVGDVFVGTAKVLNMRIVYYDKGNGGFSLKYGKSCEEEKKFTKKNTGAWKEAVLQLSPESLAKACKSADFVLHNTDAEDDAFAFVEVSAQALTPLINISDE